jgi:hypothetical protein
MPGLMNHMILFIQEESESPSFTVHDLHVSKDYCSWSQHRGSGLFDHIFRSSAFAKLSRDFFIRSVVRRAAGLWYQHSLIKRDITFKLYKIKPSFKDIHNVHFTILILSSILKTSNNDKYWRKIRVTRDGKIIQSFRIIFWGWKYNLTTDNVFYSMQMCRCITSVFFRREVTWEQCISHWDFLKIQRKKLSINAGSLCWKL